MRERVHRARPQARLGQAGHRLRLGDHQRRADQAVDAVLGAARASGGCRSSRRPESVVGIAATSAPVTAATALAVSITRPPPKATRRLDPALVEQRRGRVAGPGPARPGGRAGGRLAEAPRRRRAARSVVNSSKDSKPCSASSSGASLGARRRRKTTCGRRPSRRRGQPPRGLTTGRRFGSTSARRCSKSGGSESFSPRCSSGSSTVKPGPSVAISKRTPLGSRK